MSSLRISLSVLFAFVILLSGIRLEAQSPDSPDREERLARIDAAKLGSGRLYLRALDALRAARTVDGDATDAVEGETRLPVAVYLPAPPSPAQLSDLQSLGVRVYPGYWTPPSDNHPLGFFLADMPAVRLPDVLALSWLHWLGDAGGQSRPENNEAARAVGAHRAWIGGWTGKGVRVAVLDSGIDITPPLNDLPVPVAAKDYSDWPRIDDDVRNRITPHGTHVAGSVLGRGIRSANNTGAGGGAFRGMAPDAELVFLKIGNDTTASSYENATIAALHDAVSVYDVDVINMSYGGWGAYHDGSEADEQKADWCFDNGVAVFFSAGNSRDAAKHYSEWVEAQAESDFIEVRYSVPSGGKAVRPSFNMIWFDGPGVQRPMSLRYFDENKQEITALNVAPTTESPRGTQSQYSSTVDALPPGDAVRFLKIVNGSNERQFVHLYEDMNEGSIRFVDPDPEYTIGSPSTADRVMAVAAWSSRSSFVDQAGSRWQFSQREGAIASFSSRGPRVDGVMKPDIAAPGTAIISVRDRGFGTTPAWDWVDNDGTPGGPADYQAMQGTSMASPVCAGAAALVLQKYPQLSPGALYDTLRARARQDAFTDAVPNAEWGSGKLDVGFLADLPPTAPVWVRSAGTLPAGTPPVAAITVHPSGAVFALTEDGHGSDPAVFRSNNNGASWTQVLQKTSLSGLCVLADGSLLVFEPEAGKQHRSANEGGAWTEATAPMKASDPRRACGDSLVVAATADAGPQVSTVNGAGWQSARGDLTAGAEVRCVEGGREGWVFASVMAEGKFRLYRAHRENWTWERMDNGIRQDESVMDIRLLADGGMLAVTERRCYRSDDLGGWWRQTEITNGQNRRLQPATGETVFLANGSAGVLRSIDGGRSWEPYSSGLARTDVAGVGAAAGTAWCAAGNQIYRSDMPPLPGAPLLVAPVDGTANAGASTQLRWNPVGNATGYDVQVGRGPDLHEVLFELRGHEAVTVTASGLSANEELFWRVRAVNGSGAGPWSAAWMFMTGKAIPSVPVLLIPDDGTTSSEIDQPLVWETARRATSYELQVSADPTFTTLGTHQQNYGDTSFVNTLAVSGVVQYWRVRARNGQGTSAWSPVRSYRAATLPGDAGYALRFDHRGDMVTVPHNAAFDEIEATDEFTFEAWVNIEHYDNGFFPIFDKYKPSIDWGWQFLCTYWGVELNTIYSNVSSGVAVETGKWTHVAISYRRSAGTARFYLNGALSAEKPFDGDLPDVESEHPLLVGYGPSGGDEQAFGMIDEVRIWNVARSEQEIRDNMNVRLAGNETGLVLCLAFDEGMGTATDDLSGHAATSTLVQHPEWVVSDAVWGPPPAPRLLLPAEASTDNFLRPLLRWSTATGAQTYEIEVATDNGFASPVFSKSALVVDGLYPDVDLPGNGLLYWRVRAGNAEGDGPWSTVGSFRTAAQPPAAPVLKAPANAATTVTLPASLQWNPSDGATAYRLRVGTDQLFAGTVFDSAGVRGTAATIPTLQANITYYWQVAASNAVGSSPWSETWRFTATVLPPGAPLLVEPADRAADLTAPVTLRWQSVPLARAYHVQVARDALFSPPLVHDARGLTSVTRTLDALAPGETFFWRVRASNDGGDGPWSAVWRFSTAAAELDAPLLLEPDDAVTAVPVQPSLRWTSVPRAERYELAVASDAAFSAALIAESSLTDTLYQVAAPLPAGTWAFWRVRAANSAATGPWSTASRFRVLRPLPGLTRLLDPPDAAMDLPAQPLLRWERLIHVDSFRVQLSAGADFSVNEEDILVGDSSHVTGILEAGSSWFWRVRGENEAGAGAWSEVRGFRVRTETSVDDPPAPVRLHIDALYPQPAHGLLHLRIAGADGAPCDVQVVDLLGRLRLHAPNVPLNGTGEIQIRISDMTDGWYVLRVTSANAIAERLFLLLR